MNPTKPNHANQADVSSRVRHGRWAVLVGAVIGVVALLPACSSTRPASLATEYPLGVRQGQTLDIQVVRRAQRITMTNTTAMSFGPSRLWLNRRFSCPIEEWKVGQTLDLHLSVFVDEFGEEFRPGGFFAAENPDKIVHAQIESPRLDLEADGPLDFSGISMFGLVVVPPVE